MGGVTVRDWVRSLPLILRENLPLIVVTVAWTVAWQVAWRLLDLPVVTNRGAGYFLGRLGRFLAFDLGPVLLLVIPLLHLLRGGRARDFGGAPFWRELARRYLNARVLGGLVVVLACMPFFFAAYRDWKTAIPAMVPFWMDPALEAADRWLHGGRHPWEWLHSWLVVPARTHLVDGVYLFWFEALLSMILWMGFTRHRWVRARFFITLLAVYVLVGHLGAMAFSSAGPVYFTLVTGIEPDPFAPLMEYLRALDDRGPALFAVGTHHMLWAGYLGEYDGVINGISAFPSVHLAVATLLALTGFALNRFMGWAGLLFLAFILVGSVHLGWHYALDGYASIVIVAVLWWIAGPLTRRYLIWADVDVADDPRAPPFFSDLLNQPHQPTQEEDRAHAGGGEEGEGPPEDQHDRS